MSHERDAASRREAILSGITALFVPANRPDRWRKAAAAGADFIVVDLEDAVPAPAKDEARRALVEGPLPDCPVAVRINGVGTPWHDADMAALAGLPIDAVMVPKLERPETAASVFQACSRQAVTVGIVETAEGLDRVRELAHSAAVARLAVGTIDLCADLDCAHTREALLLARSELVLASRLAQIPAPLDGVTAAVSDAAAAEDDARHARQLGMGGKLLIHPAQVAPALRGFAPGEEEIAWATRIAEAAGDGAAAVSGEMVDAPVRKRAAAILARASRAGRP
jgi:citrate lyase subunit beta/citryl-CoA lyase